MGGSGSGRHWHYSSKSTVNSYRSIDIRKWHRNKLLTPGRIFIAKWMRDDEIVGSIGVIAEEKCILLSYQRNNSEESKDMKYAINIEWTSCNLGGMRPWFRCPALNCGRRVAILYSGAIFACRHCCQLVYPCQRENLAYRTASGAEKIRDRLGWEFSIFDGEGLKPKGMHRKTFEKLRIKHNILVALSLADAVRRFGLDL